jgi:hypothetical protein
MRVNALVVGRAQLGPGAGVVFGGVAVVGNGDK